MVPMTVCMPLLQHTYCERTMACRKNRNSIKVIRPLPACESISGIHLRIVCNDRAVLLYMRPMLNAAIRELPPYVFYVGAKR